VFKPTKEFHTARHTLYSAEENMEIDKVVPVAASVKTKLGRSGTGEEQVSEVLLHKEKMALPVCLVDNVATTGTTLAAARHALGFGTGLVFADALPNRGRACRWRL
jgi:hypothetical protein